VQPDLYFIALIPPAPVRERVRTLQLEMQQRFGTGQALKSPAHITLQMPFRLQPEACGILEKTLRQFTATQHPFTLVLKDFDCFAPRVIFVKIKDHGPIMELEGALKSVLSLKQFLRVRGPGMLFHPHMTIATRDLEAPAFEKAWAEFKMRPFHMDFEVSSLFLLRHNGSFWEIYREFEFRNPFTKLL